MGELEKLIVIFVVRVFLFILHDPLEEKTASTADYPGDPASGHLFGEPADKAAVYRHEIDAVFRLALDDSEKIFLCAVRYLPAPSRHIDDRLVDRNRPHRDGAFLEDRPPDRVDVSACREVHQRVGSRFDRDFELLQLYRGIVVVGTGTYVGVDLRAQALPYTYHPAVRTRVPVDHDPAVGDKDPDLFGIDSFELRHFLQCGGHLARPGLFDFRQSGASSRHSFKGTEV